MKPILNIEEKDEVYEVVVSIITPSYNSEKYIKETIDSVLKQSISEWEMIIVDDNSTDKTIKIIKECCEKDSRIKLIQLKENKGAANARNIALGKVKGKYVAYLDADDVWYEEKLEKQLRFMEEGEIGFSCSSYEVINDSGKDLAKFIKMKEFVDRDGFLMNNLLQTVGIMVNLERVDKKYLVMPDMRRRQDAATWLQVLKSGEKCYGMAEVLAKYRRTENSLSSNKFKAVTGVWFLYRKVEKLNLIKSICCFIRYAFLAVWKRIYI